MKNEYRPIGTREEFEAHCHGVFSRNIEKEKAKLLKAGKPTPDWLHEFEVIINR